MNGFTVTGAVDTSVFCGYWPFRRLPVRDLASLKVYLEQQGVGQAWVTSSEAILYPDPMQGNAPLLAEAAADPFWLPAAIIDVTLPGWLDDAQSSLAQGAGLIKLVPNYHGYRLSHPEVDVLARMAEEKQVPIAVQMRMMDERTHHPLMQVPAVAADFVADLARRHPQTKFLACGAYARELRRFAGLLNLWSEISLVERAETLAQAIADVGYSQLLFGSHSPFITFAAAAAKLAADPTTVTQEQINAVKQENAARLISV